MLSHLIALLLLLLAIWYWISPLRRHRDKLKQELAQQHEQMIHQQQSVDAMLGQLKDMVVRMDR